MRLWLAWCWSRLTRQHRIPWWEVRVEFRRSLERERLDRALQAHLARMGMP